MNPIWCALLVVSSFHQAGAARPSAANATEQPRFSIGGTLVDAPSGQPLAHGQVFIAKRGDRDFGESVTTGSDGRFLFSNLPAGFFVLSAQRRGYLSQIYKQHGEFSTAIITGPDLNTTDLRFELHSDSAITGRVLDETNDPVRNAQVMLLEQGVRQGRRGTWQQNVGMTDDQGRYRFGHLAPGTYLIAISAQPWYARHGVQTITFDATPGRGVYGNASQPDEQLDVAYPVTFFSNATDILGATPISVRSGETESADVILRPVPALHVTVRGNAATEYVSAYVMQQLTEGVRLSLPAGTLQSEPGVFEIVGLPPGQLNIGWRSNTGNLNAGRSFSMPLAANAEITLAEIPPSATVSGVVKMDDGSPVQGTYIQLHDRATGQRLSMLVGENGEFSEKKAIEAGTYEVFPAGRIATGITNLSATNAKVYGRSVEVEAGQDVKLTLVLAKGEGQVTGFALKNGKPTDGVMIVLAPEGTDRDLALFRRDQSDSDGSFRLASVLPGKYIVIAIENASELDWLNPKALQKYLPAGERVQIVADAKVKIRVNVQD